MGETAIETRPANPGERDAWNRFVLEAGGSFFHSWEWWDVVERATGEQALRLAAFERGELVGAACALARKRLGWRVAVNPLLTPVAGVLVAPSGRGKLRAALRETSRRRGALLDGLRRRFDLIHLQTLGDPDMRDWLARGFRVSPRYTYETDLSQGVERLWKSFDGSARRQIQKARDGSGNSVVEGAAWEEVAGLVRATFERQGSRSPIPPALVREIVEAPELESRRLALGVRDGAGDLLSAIVALWDAERRTAFYALAASRSDALASGAPSWLVWELFRRLSADKGLKAFDFCGANHEGASRFKEGFEPRLVQQWDVEWTGSLLAAAARKARKAWASRRG